VAAARPPAAAAAAAAAGATAATAAAAPSAPPIPRATLVYRPGPASPAPASGATVPGRTPPARSPHRRGETAGPPAAKEQRRRGVPGRTRRPGIYSAAVAASGSESSITARCSTIIASQGTERQPTVIMSQGNQGVGRCFLMFGLVWIIANIWRSFTDGDTFVIPDYFLPYFSRRFKISVFIAEFRAQYVVFVSSSLPFKK
jgi:hypothetical protein